MLGDIISALLHLLAGKWTGFGFELASTLARAAAFIGDLGKTGIISMPPFLADVLSGLKWVSTVIDVAGGIFNWFNPLSGTVNLFGKWAIDRVKLYGASRIAQLVASGLSATGTVFIPDMLGSVYWDGQIAQANAYSDQQAYNVCLQDYASEPGMC
ncbi:MAG TPA: hypothetical protein VFV38_48670 [Ktedonobacteraceae bacterium]|nr:hypothetical protein [Ktedonobacteraceae bacterium]